MELSKDECDRGIETILQQIAEYHGVKLQDSKAKKFIELLRETQNRYRLTETIQIEIKQDPVNLLIYINSLLKATAKWEESRENTVNLALCQSFLQRIMTMPKSQEQLIFCEELVKIFWNSELDPCSPVFDILAAAEKSIRNAESRNFCPSCNKMTKGFQGETNFFCGFCGQTLIPK